MNPGARLLAVGGGKGGVGKSFVAANLAVALADEGQRVLAIDTDLPGANLHTCLGVAPPSGSLVEFVTGREHDLGKLAVDTSIESLRLIGATGGHPGFARLRPARRAELTEAVRRMPCDFAVLDCAAGTHPEVIDFFLGGDEGLLVLTPEPTSVENAYAFLQAALYRRLRRAMPSPEVQACIDQAMDPRNEQGMRTPLDLLREVQAIDRLEAERFVQVVRGFRPCLLVNQVRSVADIKLGFSIASVCKKYFGVDADYVGYVNHDEAARRSLVARRPLLRAAPESDAAVYLRRIARKLLGRARRAAAGAESRR